MKGHLIQCIKSIFSQQLSQVFNDETNNRHWTKLVKTFCCKNMALITEI
jgi:hypothetical protein